METGQTGWTDRLDILLTVLIHCSIMWVFFLLVLSFSAQTRDRNPHTSAANIAEGKRLYVLACRTCHGDQGERPQNGLRLQSKTKRHGASDREMFHAVANGVAGTAMPGSFLDEDSIWKILAYARTLERDTEDHTAIPSIRTVPMKQPVNPVTNEQLLNPPPGTWLHYSGNYLSHRFSPLNQINASNAGGLKLLWAFQRPFREKFETTPIVVDGTMYITVPPNDAYALDAETGDVFWEYRRALPSKIPLCCGSVNRGFAIAGDKLFLSTLDAHLVALDRRTGKVVWDTKMAEVSEGYSATVAPIVIKDKVVTGVAGGEYGIRGFVDAYRISDGSRAWRSYMIPGPGEFGNDTWEGDSWKRGGAGVWVTGSYDPDLNLTYWGTANPGPDWNGDVRKGDNLFSDSVVALDADTGVRKWHFQFTPHDTHDWDAVQIMVLVNRQYQGRMRKLLITANRNGFYYVLDRETGQYLHSQQYIKQTWAKEIDSKGRPVIIPGLDPTPEGVRVWPSAGGGTNWWSPSYSPQTGFYYVAAMERSAVYFKNEAVYKPGMLYEGGTARADDDTSHGAIRALDALTGEKRWEFKMDTISRAGLLSTGGNVLVGGTGDGRILVLDARDGRELFKVNLGGQVIAGPVSYLSRNRQRIAIAAGNGMFVFGLE